MRAIRRSFVATVLGFAMTCCLAAPTLAKAVYPTTDVMRDFFRAYDSSPNVFGKLAAFKKDVIVPHPALFDNDEFQLDDAHLAWYLQRIGPRIDAMRAISRRLAVELPQIESRFDTAFPEMRGVSVAIMPSLSHFDGQTHCRVGFNVARELAKTRSLDALAKLGGSDLETQLDSALDRGCGT